MRVKISEHAHNLLLKLAEQSIAKPAQAYAQGVLDMLHLIEGEDLAVLAQLRLQEWLEQGQLDGSDGAHLLELLMDFLSTGSEVRKCK